ncbi:MAG: FtsL-like putative cell division protein [Flavobacteriales bacterium]|nr:FtsL-like putative cell division protein [Flavobacteriales bacterium]|tara:strand:- start:9676 stop:9981 length:306 start_codon:yes stop_codon:yes gene_type:complete
MLKRRKKTLKVNFFEKGGISNNVTFILFVVLLMIIQIGISLKSEKTIIAIRESEKKIFDLQMKSRSLTIKMTGLYKRSVIKAKLKDSELIDSDKLPLIIER